MIVFARQAARALRDFYLGAPGHPGIVARVCRVLFNALSTENHRARGLTFGPRETILRKSLKQETVHDRYR